MGQREGRAGQVDGGAKRDSKFGISRERNLVRERIELLTGKGMQGLGSAAALSALYIWLPGGVKLPPQASSTALHQSRNCQKGRKGYKAGPR